MLVLSRKVMETILIPHLGISLKVLRVGGGKVSLGIEAPPDVSIIRSEIASSEQMKSFTHRLKPISQPTNRDRRNGLPSTSLTPEYEDSELPT